MILKKYYEKVLLDDILNQSRYETLTKIPHIKKIIISFTSDNGFKVLASQILALKLISFKKEVTVIKAKRHNSFLKIKKGVPVGSMVELKGSLAYTFLHRLICQVLPNHKPMLRLALPSPRPGTHNSFSFTITDLTTFPELDQQFYFFKDLPFLSVTIVTNTSSQTELRKLLQMLKLSISSTRSTKIRKSTQL